MKVPQIINWPEALKTHESWLRKVLRCRMGDSHAVDDALQDIAVVVSRQMNRSHSVLPSDPAKVGPWLYRVAIRQAVNFHRKRAAKKNPEIKSEIEVQADAVEPLDWMLNQESLNRIHQAIEKLSASEREILMLKFTENWTYQQLADRLGISVRAVEHRLVKAKAKLRKQLRGHMS